MATVRMVFNSDITIRAVDVGRITGISAQPAPVVEIDTPRVGIMTIGICLARETRERRIQLINIGGTHNISEARNTYQVWWLWSHTHRRRCNTGIGINLIGCGSGRSWCGRCRCNAGISVIDLVGRGSDRGWHGACRYVAACQRHFCPCRAQPEAHLLPAIFVP
jgi:hypothetical protein